MVASVAEQFLLGLYLGVLTGILPGVVAWSLGFLFKYFTRVTIPALGVLVIAVALAGIQGGLLGLLDAQGVTSLVAVLVVMMVSMYCHALGDRMGASFPHRVTLRGLKDRTLSAEVVERVGRFGQVRIEVAGEVVEMEGYAPVSDETKRRIKQGDWTFPADLSVAELEDRFAERLVDEFDLADVSVSIDERGNARVVAAPPIGGLSKRVESGKRAVSFDVLIPSGVALGDKVTVDLGDGSVSGKVVSARSGDDAEDEDKVEVGAEEGESAPTTTGGEGRITVAVDRSDAKRILEGEPRRVLVRSAGNRREYELISVLRSAGQEFRRITVGSVDEGTTVRSLGARDDHGVIVLAVRSGASRSIAPRADESVEAGDSLFVVGPPEGVEAFKGAVG